MANLQTPSFRKLFSKLDPTVQRLARKAYVQYRRDPKLVNFESKGRLKVRGKTCVVYGARINDNWRALAILIDSKYYWYWIGTHTDYDRMLEGLTK